MINNIGSSLTNKKKYIFFSKKAIARGRLSNQAILRRRSRKDREIIFRLQYVYD